MNRSKMIRALCLPIVAAAVAPGLAQDAAIPPKDRRATEVRLPAGIVAIPFVMVREFPFVAASVSGVAGKVMLDTGAESALMINDHRVPVRDVRTIGTGHFGSGQSYALKIVPTVEDIHIGPLAFPRATLVQSQSSEQLEAITPDFLGWFGYRAWAGHALKMDYRQRVATFYGPAAPSYLAGERPIASLRFQTRAFPNDPIMAATIGDLPVAAVWDTGQYGTLYTSTANRDRLIAAKVLTRAHGDPDLFDLHALSLDGQVIATTPSIRVNTSAFPPSAAMQIGEPDVLTVGYGFLRHYKTVWDFERRRIVLLKR